MSFEIVPSTTTFAPLNTTIDADDNYHRGAFAGCNCGSAAPMEGLDFNTVAATAMIGIATLWFFLLRPTEEDRRRMEEARAAVYGR